MVLDAAVLVFEVEGGGAPVGMLQTDSLSELITSHHRRNHGDDVIDGLCQTQDVGGAGRYETL